MKTEQQIIEYLNRLCSHPLPEAWLKSWRSGEKSQRDIQHCIKIAGYQAAVETLDWVLSDWDYYERKRVQ
jgi:hypothetical protein